MIHGRQTKFTLRSLERGSLTLAPVNTRSMQGMFGASVSELYLWIKLLINIERTVDLCVITKKKQKRNTHHAYTETVSQGWL